MKTHEIIKRALSKLGGSGSGHFGHAGRPGKRGGSASTGGGGGTGSGAGIFAGRGGGSKAATFRSAAGGVHSKAKAILANPVTAKEKDRQEFSKLVRTFRDSSEGIAKTRSTARSTATREEMHRVVQMLKSAERVYSAVNTLEHAVEAALTGGRAGPSRESLSNAMWSLENIGDDIAVLDLFD